MTLYNWWLSWWKFLDGLHKCHLGSLVVISSLFFFFAKNSRLKKAREIGYGHGLIVFVSPRHAEDMHHCLLTSSRDFDLRWNVELVFQGKNAHFLLVLMRETRTNFAASFATSKVIRENMFLTILTFCDLWRVCLRIFLRAYEHFFLFLAATSGAEIDGGSREPIRRWDIQSPIRTPVKQQGPGEALFHTPV